MSFTSILREIAEGCDAIGAVLMGVDGIPIEQVSVRPAPGGPLAEDLGTAGVEFGRVLDEVRKAADGIAAGALRETVIVLARVALLFRSIDDETYLVVVLEADGNLGKARYLIRRHLLALREEL